MILLIPIHSISLLALIPALIIFILFNIKYVKKEYKFFLSFLLIPIIGIFFFMQIMNLNIAPTITRIFAELQFTKGWGVLEANNSPTEIYSPIGYILAALGAIYITTNKNNLKKYSIYLIWPITLIISIMIFKITGTSYLSPYQRNLYYLVISLPFLSALGLYYLITKIKQISFDRPSTPLREGGRVKGSMDDQTKKIVTFITIILILFLTFQSYYKLPETMQLYQNINQDNYEALMFLKQQPNEKNTKVIAPALIATTIFPITNHQPLATTFFYGDRNLLFQFFLSPDCNTKNQIIKQHNVSYVLTEQPINCNWEVIYNKNNNIIYKV